MHVLPNQSQPVSETTGGFGYSGLFRLARGPEGGRRRQGSLNRDELSWGKQAGIQ